MTKRTNMHKNAEEYIDFIREKRAKGLSFSVIAELLRNRGVITNSGAVTKAYNKYKY